MDCAVGSPALPPVALGTFIIIPLLMYDEPGDEWIRASLAVESLAKMPSCLCLNPRW